MFKEYIFGTVILTQLSAIIYNKVYQTGSLPYFPIEISRTAASNPFSYIILFGGAILSVVNLIQTLKPQSTLSMFGIILGGAGLVCLAIFDDVNHWAMHMLGVLGLMIGSFFAIFFSPANISPQLKFIYLTLILSLMFSRWIIKTLAVMAFEMGHEDIDSIPALIDFITNDSTRRFVLNKSLDIMYHGENVCRNPGLTIPMFKVAGILQWVVFYLLLEIFSISTQY